MGHSQAEKAESRERILDAAAARIRAGGLDNLSIDALMRQASLTRGGFYGHFRSRSALTLAALGRALDGAFASQRAVQQRAGGGFRSLVTRYLSRAHRDGIGQGCPIASLAADVARCDDPQVRALMAERLEGVFERTARSMGEPGGKTDAAVAAWSTMLGGLLLARVFGPGARGDEILAIARQAALAQEPPRDAG